MAVAVGAARVGRIHFKEGGELAGREFGDRRLRIVDVRRDLDLVLRIGLLEGGDTLLVKFRVIDGGALPHADRDPGLGRGAPAGRKDRRRHRRRVPISPHTE